MALRGGQCVQPDGFVKVLGHARAVVVLDSKVGLGNKRVLARAPCVHQVMQLTELFFVRCIECGPACWALTNARELFVVRTTKQVVVPKHWPQCSPDPRPAKMSGLSQQIGHSCSSPSWSPSAVCAMLSLALLLLLVTVPSWRAAAASMACVDVAAAVNTV